MINGRLEQFLDTGWYSEATIFYKGYIYWCEADTDAKTHMTTFKVEKWKAINEDNEVYHSVCDASGEPVGYEEVYSVTAKQLDIIIKKFLTADIFDGKSFWDVESELAWLEEGDAVIEE